MQHLHKNKKFVVIFANYAIFCLTNPGPCCILPRAVIKLLLWVATRGPLNPATLGFFCSKFGCQISTTVRLTLNRINHKSLLQLDTDFYTDTKLYQPKTFVSTMYYFQLCTIFNYILHLPKPSQISSRPTLSQAFPTREKNQS